MSTTSRRSLKRAAAGVSAGVLTLSGFAAIATPATAQSNFSLQRQAGADRYLTAAQIATNAFTTADTVLIASGEAGHFADALTGNFLAGRTGSPVLLTAGDALPKATSDALATLKATKVTILGGTAAVSQKVQDALAANYTVTRIGGANRYATGAQVAAAGGTVGQTEGKGATAFLASGLNFADALVAGGPAYAGRLPVAVTDANTLSPETSQSLTDLAIKNVVIVGGTSAVSQKVEDAVKAKGITVTRLAGTTRQATAAAVANYATGTASGLGFSKALVDLATGADFADALAGGPSAGKDKAPLLLAVNANTLGADTTNYLTSNSGTLTGGKVFGGTAAVSDSAVAAAQTAGRTAPASNQTYSVTPNATAIVPLSTNDETTTNDAADDRQYTVSGLDATKSYRVELIDAANVTFGSNGQVTFADSDGTANQADGLGSSNAAHITVLNNAPATGDAVVTVPGSTTLSFTIEGDNAGSVIPVVFQDADNDGELDLTAPTTANANPKAPSEPFGAGGKTTFVAPEAPLGSNGFWVEVADTTADYLSGNGLTYNYDGNDTYRYQGVGISQAQFESMLNKSNEYDSVNVNYNPDAAGVSVFDLGNDGASSTSQPTVAVKNLDGGATMNDVVATFTPNVDAASGETYRLRQSADNGSTWTIVTGATQAAGTTAGTLTITKNNVADGTYRYDILTTSAVSGQTNDSSNSTSTVVPGTAATATPPLAVDTVQTTSLGLSNSLDTGDVFKVVFDEAIAAPTAGDLIRVNDGSDNSVGDVVNGTNATFTYNSAATETVNGAVRPIGTVLTVTMTGAPTVVAAGTTAGIQLPATITDQSGTTDVDGAAWALGAGQDLLIDTDAADNQTNSADAAPVFSSATPANTATAVAVTTSPTAAFNETLAGTSNAVLTTAADTTTSIPSVVTVSGGNITINPDNNLAATTAYRVTYTARDAAGNVTTQVINFTTA